MRGAAYFFSAVTGLLLVKAGGAVLTVVGLGLVFMSAYNIGWSHSEIVRER